MDGLGTDFDHLPGVAAAGHRLLDHDQHVLDAFDSLDIFSNEDARLYVESAARKVRVPDDAFGLFIGVLLAFGMTCVEADRELRGGGAMTA